VIVFVVAGNEPKPAYLARSRTNRERAIANERHQAAVLTPAIEEKMRKLLVWVFAAELLAIGATAASARQPAPVQSADHGIAANLALRRPDKIHACKQVCINSRSGRSSYCFVEC
jgi:hypothetical protein